MGVFLKLLIPVVCLAGLAYASVEPSSDFSHFEQDLLSKSYTAVPFGRSQEEIAEVMAAFYDFLALDQQTLANCKSKLDSKSRRSDLGYEKRESSGSHFDDKEFFHYHPALWEEMSVSMHENPVIYKFITRAHLMWEAARSAVQLPLAHLETRYPGTRIPYLVNNKFILRFLRYSPAKIKGELLAKGHFDAGSMTLAIAESAPGLRMRHSSGTMQEVTHEEGRALFFLASTFQKQVNDSHFHPAWHDVVRKSENNEVRWALVFFCEAPNVLPPSWEETHTAS